MKQELIIILVETFPELTKSNAQLIIDNFCKIKEPKLEMPPEVERPPMQWITFDSLKNEDYPKLNKDNARINKGYSIKPGNILINMKKLLIDSSEIGLTIAGVYTSPYLIPLAALVIWNKVWSNIKIELNEKHAMAIKIMWENRNLERDWIEEQKAHQLYNKYLKSRNRNEIILEEFLQILQELEKMKCIEKTDNGYWWLREWVKKPIN